MELIVHIYYRTMKFSKGNFSTTLPIQAHARTVHCSVMTLLKILQVWQTEAPHIWRFLSRAYLLLSLSLRIYSLCHTPRAPISTAQNVTLPVFFMILAGFWKSEMRAAVIEWEGEQGANFLPVSGSISSAFSSNVYFLPKEISSPSLPFQMETGLTASWTTSCRSLSPSAVSRAHHDSSDQQSLAWDSWGKSHKLLLKGPWKVNGKASLASTGLCGYWIFFSRQFAAPE